MHHHKAVLNIQTVMSVMGWFVMKVTLALGKLQSLAMIGIFPAQFAALALKRYMAYLEWK